MDISWPCILVFVGKWVTERPGTTTVIPKTLYMPDGRAISVCTVLEPKIASKKKKIIETRFSR